MSVADSFMTEMVASVETMTQAAMTESIRRVGFMKDTVPNSATKDNPVQHRGYFVEPGTIQSRRTK